MRASMTPCIPLLTCPVCGAALSGMDRSLRCPDGHTYDMAREGYVDLAPAGHGRSRRAGDTRAMLEARRRFLQQGHYDALAATLAAMARDQAAADSDAVRDRAGPGGPGTETGGTATARTGTRPFTVLDAGCGEGHYLRRVAGELAATASCCLFGVDLSREALRMAARALPEARFFLNDVANGITMADGSVDLLLDVFAPRNPAEFARVTAPGGALVVVIPGDGHLRELRDRLPLLDIHPDKRDHLTDQLTGAFRLEQARAVVNRLTMSGNDVVDLLAMGPNAWHLDEEALEAARSLDGIEVAAEFEVLRFRRLAHAEPPTDLTPDA